MIRKALLLLAASFCATFAHSQAAVYGTVTLNSLTGMGSSPLAPRTYTVAGNTFPLTYSPSVNPIGGAFGVFYDFRTFGRFRVGADARGVITNGKRGADLQFTGSGTRIASGLAGVRVSIRVPLTYLKPYVEGAAGIGRSDYGFNRNASGQPQPVNNFEYHAFAGVDLRALPVLDWRVVELGYGGLDPFGNNAHNFPLRSISTGLVVHFPKL